MTKTPETFLPVSGVLLSPLIVETDLEGTKATQFVGLPSGCRVVFMVDNRSGGFISQASEQELQLRLDVVAIEQRVARTRINDRVLDKEQLALMSLRSQLKKCDPDKLFKMLKDLFDEQTNKGAI